MKKRLRKKKYLGEFYIQQWWISCTFQLGLSEARVSEIKEQFSELANEQRFFVFIAGNAESCSFILDGTRHYKTPTETQRQVMSSFLQNIPEVVSIEDHGLGQL
ncbi:50S ribosome-binding protein YggL [Hymenobacter sp. GOD-10R]|uniref:50S ribosome-binding protein YggL n=1 Tax=Hymenobacter sp. GOD-10R TaxID=3093922 RepID=UPI002D7A013B|nr:50S ribosome-binding protein YggL [Hymenobacter sp. GOD-10R]WRQ27806.1 50S ribosome-binding protein YggL [Hymenobacter sp. GOD-10R]